MVLSQSKNRSSVKLPYDLANKILNRLPPEYRRSFSIEQVEALQTALIMQGALDKAKPKPLELWKFHLGPLCLSLDLKNQQNLHANARRQSVLVPILCMLVTILGIGCVASLLKFRYEYQSSRLATSLQAQEQEFHPAVLPFRTDQDTCEENGAIWMDQECVDYGHNPTF
ncbi:MAG: hypothetical protein AAF821_01165 [Cyanobacteria bacterium P01_D01_bin.156]